MELSEYLSQINDQFYNEKDEDLEFAIDSLKQVHHSVEDDSELFEDFKKDVLSVCGGSYIPIIFWIELNTFFNDESNRMAIFNIIDSFCDSDFTDGIKSNMKPLLITYFAIEKEFEINKLKSFVIEKKHPEVQSFFQKLLNFVEKNKDSVQTYITKFKLLKTKFPDFELMNLPIKRLNEQLAKNRK